MSQINVNAPPPSNPPPPPPPPRWPLYVVIAILVILVIAALAAVIGRRAAAGPSVQATPTPTIVASAGGGATATPGATSQPQPPTNPTSMRVVSGSCTVHRIVWRWSGARRATSYEVVVYDPVSGADVKNGVTATMAYTLPAGPGATVALKVRSHNAAGTAPSYFTPNSVGRVPPRTTKPTAMTVSTSGHTLNWAWTGAKHATAYDLVLYHYHGSAARADITARTNQPRWSVPVTPGITYHLKVRSVGECAPPTYYTPSTSAIAGATPTPGA